LFFQPQRRPVDRSVFAERPSGPSDTLEVTVTIVGLVSKYIAVTFTVS